MYYFDFSCWYSFYYCFHLHDMAMIFTFFPIIFPLYVGINVNECKLPRCCIFSRMAKDTWATIVLGRALFELVPWNVLIRIWNTETKFCILIIHPLNNRKIFYLIFKVEIEIYQIKKSCYISSRICRDKLGTGLCFPTWSSFPINDYWMQHLK